MKSAKGGSKITLDLSQAPQLLDLLRLQSAQKGVSQKSIVIEALQAYFSSEKEDLLLLSAANKAFQDWDNEDDKVYDTI